MGQQRSQYPHPAHRHADQIIARRSDEFTKLSSIFAVTYRNLTDSIDPDRTLRPFGTTALVVMSYHTLGDQPSMPLRAFKPELQDDGSVLYFPIALNGDGLVLHDVALPLVDGESNPIYPAIGKNRRSFLEWVLQLDYLAASELGRDSRLPTAPVLPHVYLAFDEGNLPEVDMTPAFYGFAQRQLRRESCLSPELIFRKINQPDVIAKLALEDYYRKLLIYPGEQAHPESPEPRFVNTTDQILMHTDFCTQASKAVAAYEHFAPNVMRGKKLRNPARDVIEMADRRAGFDRESGAFRVGERLQVDNPVREVFKSLGLTLPKNRADGFDQLAGEQLDEIEFTMAAAISLRGGKAALFSAEDIYRAIEFPDRQVVAAAEIVKRMRRLVRPFYRPLVTDAAWEAAALHPGSALDADRVYRVQVCKLQRLPLEDAFNMGPAQLGRRAMANLWVDPASANAAVVLDELPGGVDNGDLTQEHVDVEQLPALVDYNHLG